MKRSRRIYILLGVLVVICIATFAVSQYEERAEEIRMSREVILDLSSEEATAISWKTEDYFYSFHRDGSWISDDDEEFPVNDDKIDSLIDMFTEYEADFIITDVDDYGQYGLDDPVCTVNITLGDDAYEITMGDFSALDSERYISVNKEDVYLVETDPLDSFELEMTDLIEHDSLDRITEASSITFEGQVNYSIYYEEDSSNTYCADDVYFVSGTDDPLDTSNVSDYLKALRTITLYDYATYNASEDELELFGMNDPVLVISVDYTKTDDDNEVSCSVTLTVGRDQDELALSEESEDEEDEEDEEDVTAYVRVNDSQIIYELESSDYYSLLAASYDDLRHYDVLPVDFDDVSGIDIELDENIYTIFSEPDNDAEDEENARSYYYYYDGEVIDAEELDEDDDIDNYREEIDISEFSSYIDEITAESFTDEDPEDKMEIGLTVYLDNDNFPEVTVELYRYDAGLCLAVIDGVPTSLVERSCVVDLIEAVYEIVL